MFEYLAKGAKQREQAVAEEQVCAAVRSLRRRRGGGDQLLAYRAGSGWHDVTAADINDYLREISGGDYTAKDFRTWHATVLAAVGLAVSESAAGHEAARKRAIARVVREVAGYLGNTPAVARASYINPRVIDLGDVAAERQHPGARGQDLVGRDVVPHPPVRQPGRDRPGRPFDVITWTSRLHRPIWWLAPGDT